MKPFPQKYIADVERFPEFMEAVQDALGQAPAKAEVIITLNLFNDDPFGLYACLWWAASQGVSVTITPMER